MRAHVLSGTAQAADPIGALGDCNRPAVGEVFHVGGLCRTTWATQNGPGWRTTKIQLMSGVSIASPYAERLVCPADALERPRAPQIETPILNIADDIDCTKSANSIVFRCPDVTK